MRPWDTDTLIASTSTIGKFLNTLLGYDSAPALLQIALYWTYLLSVTAAFLFWPAAGLRGRSTRQRVSSPQRS